MRPDQNDESKRRADNIVEEVEQRILDGRLPVDAILPSERVLRAGVRAGVENLYKMRVFIESGLVRQAATQADKNGIKILRDALKANGDDIYDSALFYKTDNAFHRVLYEQADNPILPAVHEGFTSWLAPHWDRMLRMPARNRDNHQAHTLIFEAILNRDPDAAEAALKHHLATAWDLVKETFEPA